MIDPVFTYHVDVMKDDACFEGHFPTFPVFPAVAQLGCLLQAISEYHQQACEITGLPVSKFLQPVAPDTTLQIELSLKHEGCMNFEIIASQLMVAKGRLTYRIVGS